MGLQRTLLCKYDQRRTWENGNAYGYLNSFPALFGNFQNWLTLFPDHCVEYLRQASICHADTSLVVFEWSESKSKPMLKNKRDPHMCQDWEAIEDTAKRRQVTSGEFSRLINPFMTQE